MHIPEFCNCLICYVNVYLSGLSLVTAVLCPVLVPASSLLLHLAGLLFYDFETWSLPAAILPNILYNILLLGMYPCPPQHPL